MNDIWEKELEDLLNEDISSVREREQTAFDRLVSPFGNSIVLFGAGSLGRQAVARLRQDGIEPLAFVDNNPMAWGKTVDGIDIFSPQDAAVKFGQQAAFIVTIRSHESQHRFAETKRKLLDLGCSKVVSFVPLLWQYPETFLPNYYLDLPSKIFLHADKVRAGLRLLEEDFSRKTYLTQLRWRILEDYDDLPTKSDDTQYIPKGIFSFTENEVFIDCGAFDGDTVRLFLSQCQDTFSHIYAFEPDNINFRNLQNFLSTLPQKITSKITILPVAVGARTTKLKFTTTGTASSMVSAVGDIEIEIITLDNLLSNVKPTYIKMDIEGAESDAISGATKIIQGATPVLAICAYHQQSHIWDIPLLIHSISSEYQLFLRAHEDEGWELVYYAIPTQRLKV